MLDLSQPNVVGIVNTLPSLRLACKLEQRAVDLIEIRLDALAPSLNELERRLEELRQPLIFTARHPQEGGENSLSPVTRRELLERFLPRAAAIDIELRSAERLARLSEQARARGVMVIVSHHNFSATPSPVRLHELARRALLARADVFKLAVHAEVPGDLAVLLTFFAKQKRLPLSVMGMGPLGQVSRLLFGQLGSVLNYGFLDRSSIPGQWPAVLLKQRLQELRGA